MVIRTWFVSVAMILALTLSSPVLAQRRNNQQQQPAVIQTPFGPIPNPRANQPVQPNTMPGQVPGQPNPFGAVSPFNSQPPAGQNNNFFGNTSPPLFNQNQSPLAK